MAAMLSSPAVVLDPRYLFVPTYTACNLLCWLPEVTCLHACCLYNRIGMLMKHRRHNVKDTSIHSAFRLGENAVKAVTIAGFVHQLQNGVSQTCMSA